ncbi:MAG: universal stress protein [Cytophagaceae bacterium]
MNTTCKILCPTDFSSNSRNAVIYAAELAVKINAKITLLHVHQQPLIVSDLPIDALTFEIAESHDSVQTNFNEFKRIVSMVSPSTPVSFISAEGLVNETIKSIASEDKYDLVVMGSKDVSVLDDIFQISNTGKVLGKLICPLIIVPDHCVFHNMEKIVYASDFHDSDLNALKQVTNLFGKLNPEIKVINVMEDRHLVFEKIFNNILLSHIDYPDLKFIPVTNDQIDDGIENFVKDEKPDLLVMATRNRSWAARIFSESITRKVTAHTTIPVMVFRLEGENL